MLRKLQSTDDVIISFPMIAVDGQQADTISSLAANIIQPGGTVLSNFSVASFTQPNSEGTHVANFGSGVSSLAFTVQNTANPYVVTFTDPTSGIEPTMREIWITDRYPWELSLTSEVGSAFAQVQSTFDSVGSMGTEVDSTFAQVQSIWTNLGNHDTAVALGFTSVSNAVNSTFSQVQSTFTLLGTHDTTLANHDTSLGNGVTSISNNVTSLHNAVASLDVRVSSISTGAGASQASVDSVFAQVQSTFTNLGTHDTTLTNGVSSVSNAVNSVFSQVQSTFTAVDSVVVGRVWDEILSGATHNIATSAGKRLRQIQENLGYEGGAVWIDTVNGTAGTVDFENGTVENPVDNIADANTLAASIGLAIFRVAPGSSITFAAAQNNQLFVGEHWTLALGGQDITGSQIDGATVSGISAGTGTMQMFARCILNAITHRANTHLIECGIAGTQTIGEAGDYFADRCHSAIAGTATPSWDFGAALNSSNLSFRNYSGGIEIQNMGAGTGSYNMSLEGRGQLVINANCSATSTVAIRGSFTVTDNAGGAVTLSDDARFDVTQVFSQVSSLDVRVSSIAPEVALIFSQVQSTFTLLGTHDTTLINGVTSISNNVSSLHTRVASLDVRVQSISTGAGASQASVDSVSAEVSSNNSLLAGLNTTTTIELKEEPEGTTRIEAGDTFQFIKNTLTDPQSVAVSITAPDSTTIVSLATATQSGTSTNWYYFHTDANSWHSTVKSSGQFVLEWTIFRSTGNDHEKQYFEIIKTD